MPNTTIVDPVTGRHYAISGPTRPSKGDIDQILKHLASSTTEQPWWDKQPVDKKLAPLVRQLLGADAYERAYEDADTRLSGALGRQTRSLGATAEQMIRAGARPGEVLQKLGNAQSSRRIGPYVVQEMPQGASGQDIPLGP